MVNSGGSNGISAPSLLRLVFNFIVFCQENWAGKTKSQNAKSATGKLQRLYGVDPLLNKT